MPLSTTVTGHVTYSRRIVSLSAGIGFIFFLLFVLITLIITGHRRAEHHDHLASATRHYVTSVFDELQRTLTPLRIGVDERCNQIRGELIRQAAFASNIRSILLVKDGLAFCSSATGQVRLDIHTISPQTDTSLPLDIRLVSGTPMVPHRPVMVLWMADPGRPGDGILTTLKVDLTPYLLLSSRQQEVSGMAIVAGSQALTTWSSQLSMLQALPKNPLRTIAVPGYPLTLYLYGEALPAHDLHIILLAGLLAGLVVTCGCFLTFTLRLRPGREILQGIKRGEFHVEYQPVIEASTGRVYGLEALMRWTHPTHGRIPPDSFISFAEGQNLIVPLTCHLFELIARDAHLMQQFLPRGTRLGVNVSPSHLSNETFRQDVRSWLDAMPGDHFDYIFEITERTMVTEHSADETFDWMRQQDIKIAIDDFGTGHSALIYLEKFRFDYLKIDRGFVQSIGMETVNSPVLDAVLNLAKKLNLNTVAEGVETGEQALWLLNRGITHMQGYLFSRPCTVALLKEYFLSQQTAACYRLSPDQAKP